MNMSARSESFHAVGEQIAATLRDAHLVLESYAEGEGTPRELGKCADLLHAARGALNVASIYGAGLLAEEMEATCRYLQDKGGEGQALADGVEALSRAMVQLPSYIERIMDGGRDIPLVMLPLLNDLRAARGKPLLSESTLLLLNGEPLAESAAVPRVEPSGEDIVPQLAQLRPQFQLGLLGWIKGSDAETNLRRMATVTDKLERAARDEQLYRLWWVVGGVLEALRDGGLAAGISLKRLLGQVDREIKRLQQSGEADFAAHPPSELVNNLLYYVARSKGSGPRCTAVRAAFRLDELVTSEAQVDQVRDSLAAPSPQLMRTVAGAISEDLARAKDVLDIYVRTGMEDTGELEAQVGLLRKIADTLGVLGLGKLRETVVAHTAELEALVAAGQQADEAQLVALAAAFLQVEDALETELVGLVRSADAEGEPAQTPADADYQAVAGAVLRECKVNLAHIKETITEVLERPDERRSLDSLPEQVKGVRAGLTMLGRERAVDVLNRIGEVIGSNLSGDVLDRDAGRLNRLADAIVSLEYYMETLQAGRKEPVYMLENAERSLAVLEEQQPVAVPEVDTADVSQTLRISPEDLPASIADPVAYEKTRVIEAPVMEAAGEAQPDLELLEIFIEEAREEIAAVQRHFPVWRDNPDDEEALITMRRSFHTLKGSGRMVGAQLIGEYAWSIENLLNKLISKTVAPHAPVQAFLGDAVAATPQLLEQLEAGAEPTADIKALAECANRFADGELPTDYAGYAEAGDAEHEEHTEVGAADGASPAEAQMDAQTEPAGEQIDPVLLDILTRETGGHIATVRAHLAASAAEGAAVDEAMHHACHTLHGSITMAGVSTATRLTDALNQFIEQMYRVQRPLDAVQREYTAAAVDAVEQVVAALSDAALAIPDTNVLEERLHALAAEIAELEDHVDVDLEIDFDPDAEDRSGVDVEFEAEPDVPAAVAPDAGMNDTGMDFDPEIAAIFCEEAAEILEESDQALQTLRSQPGSAQALADLQRHLHTLKGGARMAGIATMGDLSHDLETLLIRINAGSAEFDADMQDLLQASLDQLHGMREQVLDGQLRPADAELLGRIAIASQATLVTPGLSGVVPAARQPAEPPADTPSDNPSGSVATADDAAADAETDLEETGAFTVESASDPYTELADRDSARSGDVPSADEDDKPLQIPEPENLGDLAQDLIAGKPPERPEPLPDNLAPAAEGVQRREMARVDSAMLEDLLNNAGEISISHSRLKQQVSSIQFNLDELGQTVQRLQQQLRLLEMETEAQILFKHQTDAEQADRDFDPLELDRYSTIQQLSRGLSETASDVNSLRDLLQNIASDTETILSQQQRVTSELQDNLMRTRMVPFDQHVPRLQRLVRQQAQESGKLVELAVRGSSGELDRQVMERMIAPFEHMLRNAVIHGIELPGTRRAAGKPETATITIAFRREGSHVLIDVADDGAGVDMDRVRSKALQQGVIREDQEVTEEELAQLILQSGLSTAEKLTQSAGRGIGMDVVVNEIGKLGGTLSIATERGKGCTFTIRLPYTLAITQAFIVRCGAESFAMPLPTVEGVVRISRREYEDHMAATEPAVEYGGRRYRLRHLGPYLGLGPARVGPETEKVSLILVAAGENSTALITDETADAREVVIKPVGPQLAGIRGIAGATILGDGRIVVILDAPAIVRMPDPEYDPADFTAPADDDLPPLALVVDDSITMRRVTQRLLERNGMRVLTAKDGVEALELLQDHQPRIILLDVEMPRMDGYEFAGRVRANPATANLPIIMVTSRSGEKHRARAIELGVNDYLGKPYQEHEMLAAIEALIGADAPAEVSATEGVPG